MKESLQVMMRLSTNPCARFCMSTVGLKLYRDDNRWISLRPDLSVIEEHPKQNLCPTINAWDKDIPLLHGNAVWYFGA
jgi:hypothetical protein